MYCLCFSVSLMLPHDDNDIRVSKLNRSSSRHTQYGVPCNLAAGVGYVPCFQIHILTGAVNRCSNNTSLRCRQPLGSRCSKFAIWHWMFGHPKNNIFTQNVWNPVKTFLTLIWWLLCCWWFIPEELITYLCLWPYLFFLPNSPHLILVHPLSSFPASYSGITGACPKGGSWGGRTPLLAPTLRFFRVF